jgi:hypothetical protein
MESERERIKRERDVVRLKYGSLFERITTLLFEGDPMGINFETNTDEYEPEVETILPRLSSATSAQDVETIVHEEFCRWFGVEEAGPPQSYQALSARIWEEWCAFSNRGA